MGSKMTPFNMVRDTVGFEMADDIAYAAGYPPVYTFAGLKLINTYNAARTPRGATEFTPEGMAAVETIRAHLRNLFPDERDALMVESWIALNVRNPGKLIGVALLVKGAEGDGKSVIFNTMMGALMGKENVGEVSNAELRSDFSGWAIGKAVRVIEEIKASGANRHMILDAVKPLITNPEVTTIAKRKDGALFLNTTNYVGLTNHEDALPISDVDRRWWVLFTPYQHRDDLAAKVGDLRAYFTNVRDAIFDHADSLRKFFVECEIHPEVFYGMHAPVTNSRKQMIDNEAASLGGDFLDAYITSGGVSGISADVIAAGSLSAQLAMDMGKDLPRGKQLNRLLASRGYLKCEKVVKWDYKAYNVYVRDANLVKNSDVEVNKKIRELLAATLPKDEQVKALAAMPRLNPKEEAPF
jgi:hypothetical protein